MLISLFFIIIGLIVLGFILFFPFALLKVSKAEPTICPRCNNTLKLVTKTAKCTHCKAKLYKHNDGEYRIRT